MFDLIRTFLAHYRALQGVHQTGGSSVRLVCRRDSSDRLLAELALHELDVIRTDAPANPSVKVRAFNHVLGESEIGFFCHSDLANPLEARKRPEVLPSAVEL